MPRPGSEHQTDSDAADKSAQVCGETYLRAPKIESSLNRNDRDDAFQLAAGERRAAMTQKQASRDANHPHDATGNTDEEIAFG